ncbi:MAG: thioredoxin family protein [Bacilli bacterium]|nr:thioredoxin family protein [Bacilli bacterium]
MIVEYTGKQQFSMLKQAKEVLVDFYADWCAPCQKIEPHLKKLVAERPHLTVLRINIDKFHIAAAMYRINSVPTFIFLQNGSITRTAIGYMDYTQLVKFVS